MSETTVLDDIENEALAQTEAREQQLNTAIALIEWLRARPHIPLPVELQDDAHWLISGWDSKEEALQLVREFGDCHKTGDDTFFRVTKQFGHLSLTGLFYRERICERVVLGTESIPEQVIPAHEKEIVEWKCDPLLKGKES